MKIALVVFPFHPNHGCILQTLAIYTKLKEEGHKVTILNRLSTPLCTAQVLKRSIRNLQYKLQGNYKGPIFYKGHTPAAIMRNLQPFIDTYFGNDVRTFYSAEETRKFVVNNNFDAYIVGSDQVWRPKYVPDIYHYYLSFVPTNQVVKRIAFCPSFGTEEWEYNQEQTERCTVLARHFDGIAVRESSGIKLCKEHLGKDAVHLLDPTILYPAERYAEIFSKTHKGDVRDDNSRKISVYYIFGSEEKERIAHKVATILNLDINLVISHIKDVNARLKDRIAPSLDTWIKGYVDADFIVTDSFHSTMFALYFNKPFITIANAQTGVARFRSILNALKLQDRIITTHEDITTDLVTRKIEWDVVNDYLAQERKRSIDFLIRNLK